MSCCAAAGALSSFDSPAGSILTYCQSHESSASGRQSKPLHVISEGENFMLPGEMMPSRLGTVTNTQDR